ncbi:MAG TPA: hypothetical protein VHO95_01140 [Candidatus Dormibacteraeota bacterium]|nr:hypothetical protein [Candidatus Dormibacteraeota bacterium]
MLVTYADRIYGDIEKFTNVEPVRGWDEVVVTSGSEITAERQRSIMTPGSRQALLAER